MVRKLITIGIVLISFLFQGLGISDIVIKDAYAQTKTGTVKKPAVEKKKVTTAQPQKPDDFSFEVKEFPDGVIGRRYNFVLTPKEATPPYKVTIAKGSLPPGITVNQRTGGIEGEPAKVGAWPLTISLTDAKGKKGIFAGVVKVWRVLSVGEHGKFKGFDGLQMALNMAQDMDELRIEKGILYGSGLVIPSNKAWAHGIKISGGWDEAFEEKKNNPEDTILDGGGKKSRILTISNSNGTVFVENITFANSNDGAVEIAGAGAVFTNCAFTNNTAHDGGAVKGNGVFANCVFTNNSAGYGGAVYGDGTFTNCIFMQNSAVATYSGTSGGAVYGNGTFTNCTFTSNRAGWNGGAVKGNGTFTNCTFNYNAARYGGAVDGNGTFTNCTFTYNGAWDGGAVKGNGTFTNCTFTSNSVSEGGGGAVLGNGTFTNCTFMNNSATATWRGYDGNGGAGGAVLGNGTFINCTMYGNMAKYEGGAVWGGGGIINTIFYKNIAGGKDNDIAVKGNLKIDYSLVNYMSGAADFGANNIMGDPKFVDPDGGDLRLRSDSPGINAGKIIPEIKNSPFDLDGKPRIVGGKIDMGAYEWAGKQTKPTMGLIGVSAVAAGERHTVILKNDGTVWAWGANYAGQLGSRTTTTNSTTPVQVKGITGITAVSAELGTVALKNDGTVWRWGLNSTTPVQVKGLTDIIAISTGEEHSVALKNDGTVWAWGLNNMGQLGNGITNNSMTPVQVKDLTGITTISARGWHTIAFKSDGTVWVWGSHNLGQRLGDGMPDNSTTPVQVKGLTGITAISVDSFFHPVALKNDGTVWEWKMNVDGSTTHVHMQGLTGITAVSAGVGYAVAIKNDGTVWAWGTNNLGQLGDGTTNVVNEITTPVQVKGLTGITAVSTGEGYTVALKNDGTVWAWGWNEFGQLGDGTRNNSSTPVQVKEPESR